MSRWHLIFCEVYQRQVLSTSVLRIPNIIYLALSLVIFIAQRRQLRLRACMPIMLFIKQRGIGRKSLLVRPVEGRFEGITYYIAQQASLLISCRISITQVIRFIGV